MTEPFTKVCILCQIPLSVEELPVYYCGLCEYNMLMEMAEEPEVQGGSN
jgi:hypothetical protein